VLFLLDRLQLTARDFFTPYTLIIEETRMGEISGGEQRNHGQAKREYMTVIF
jgi:hypothetical protein